MCTNVKQSVGRKNVPKVLFWQVNVSK